LLSTEHTVEIGEAAFTRIPFKGDVMEIGRDPACDIPLPFPMVSWRHARLTRAPQGFMVEDLGSRNGTYLDGVHISSRTLVKPGQEIGLGSFRFQLLEGGELARREYYGNVTIEAVDITVHAPGGKRLLDPISLTVFPSELVALMGPAGAGKTTLLKALNGYTAPTEGTVLFNGADLYRYYDRFRQQMGYVPQDDIVHPQLTVRQALYFSARLRTDLTDDEIYTRTENVVRDLGIQDKIDDVIGSPERKILSGGQRKRVNIALELITDTPVLFLDEPTSGLSSYDAESVVDLLKSLSKSGKTIITTIHQPSLKVYKQFDDLIMISRDTGDKPGKMVFFGPAFPDAIQFFNPAASSKAQTAELNPEMLFSGMATIAPAMRTDAWRQRYQASRYQKEFVANRSGKRPEKRGATGEETARRHFGLRQWLALVKRNVFVKLRDRAQSVVLLAQAPLFALLVVLAIYPIQSPPPAAAGFGELAEKLPIVHFLMVIAAIWFGCNNAARDIVGEWTIYKRERMVTLKLLSYVFSKLTVLFVLCVFQCASLLLVVAAFCNLHSNLGLDFCVLLLASMIGSGLGLCISALSRTTESAIALLPVVLLPMIAVGGGMRPIYQMPAAGQTVSLVIPSRWAFEADLLQEAKAPAWGAPKPVPDLACTLIDNSPLPLGSLSMQHVPIALPPGTSAANPSLAIQSDVAEAVIPQYTITAKNPEGSEVTCRASADEDFPRANPVANPVALRHTLGESFAVLLAMNMVTTLAVIGILRKRDSDPQ
jgi:ABC-type multidrug transport system ATPase subunit/ABC-type multidrug transport system permease subunit